METIGNLILRETPNIKACYALLLMLDEQPYGCKKWFYTDDEDAIKTELSKIKNYCIKSINNHGVNIVEYHKPPHKYGRLYGNGTVQNICGIARGFLFKHTTDIDMYNCQPTILKYLCSTYNIDCPHLTNYILNREQIFKSNGGKDFVKNNVNKILNSEYKKKLDNQFLKDLDKEMFMIRLKLISENDHTKMIEHIPTDEKNYAGKAMNVILTEYESRILEDIIYCLTNNNIQIITRMFDGCLIDGNHYDNIELLEKVECYINSKYQNLNIKLVYKPHDNSIKYDFDFKIFDDVRQDFEKNHCKITDKSTFISHDDDGFVVMSDKDLRTSYSHLKMYKLITSNKKYIIDKKSNFIKEWIEDENIRKYKYLDIIPPPLKCSDNVFNLWSPFVGHKLIQSFEHKQTELDFILNHIKGLCNDEDIIYDYFIKWMAHMIQNPAQKSTAITLISNEGAGKGTLNDLIRNMLGKEKLLVSTKPKNDIFGQFNNLMATAFFVNLNEVSLKDSQECDGQLKALITDGDLTINEKGKKAYNVKSYHRWLITTNNELGLSKVHKDDRRNLIIRSSDKFIGDTKHFNYLHSIINDNDVIATCFNYFLNQVDLTQFNVNQKPITEYQKDLCELSINPVELFVKDMLMDTNDEFIKFTAKECFDEYKCFCKDNNYEFIGTQVKFGLKLKTLKIDGFENKHTKNGNVYIFDIQKCKKHFNIDKLEDYEF